MHILCRLLVVLIEGNSGGMSRNSSFWGGQIGKDDMGDGFDEEDLLNDELLGMYPCKLTF